MAEENVDRAGVDPQVVDSVTSSNLKTVGEFAAGMANMMLSNAVYSQRQSMDHGNRMNTLAESLIATAAKRIQEVDVEEAIAMAKALRGDTQEQLIQQGTALSQILASLGAAIAQLQQVTKSAQTTPPVTS